MMQGMNDHGQLGLPKEIQQQLNFFPEFIKIDALHDYFIKDIALGSCTIHAICEHKITGRVKIFGWG